MDRIGLKIKFMSGRAVPAIHCVNGVKHEFVRRREMWVHDEAETPKAARKKKGRGYDIS